MCTAAAVTHAGCELQGHLLAKAPGIQLAGSSRIVIIISHCVSLRCSGMRFFPAYINDARRQALDNAAFRWNQTGQQQKKLMKWGDRSQLQGGMLLLEGPASQQTAQKGRQAQPQPLPAGSPGTGAITNGSQTPGAAALIPGIIHEPCASF